MPYVDIKSYPRDEETTRRLVEKINAALLDVLGCPPEAVTIAFRGVAPENWRADVEEKIIAPNDDAIMIRNGQKRY